MRHTRNKQLEKSYREKGKFEGVPNMRITNSVKYDRRVDKTFKWHSEAVKRNFWSNFLKSCISFEYDTSDIPNAVGNGTKYLPTKERN